MGGAVMECVLRPGAPGFGHVIGNGWDKGCLSPSQIRVLVIPRVFSFFALIRLCICQLHFPPNYVMYMRLPSSHHRSS